MQSDVGRPRKPLTLRRCETLQVQTKTLWVNQPEQRKNIYLPNLLVGFTRLTFSL